jgi:pimeloyl-ACP methyl ester carboxylesterase
VVSSYAVTDRLIAMLEKAGRFPNLQQVLIAGHSAGGQFVNRYAAGSGSSATEPAAVTRRYVVANPSSYLYWNATRRIAGSWRVLSAGEVASCPGFNTYKYGLAKRTGYMAAVNATTLSTRYANSRVTYLLGALDTNPSDSSMDTGCAAKLQGSTRLERGLRYAAHLRRVLPPVVTARHRTVVVPGVGHTARGMFISPQGQTALFP